MFVILNRLRGTWSWMAKVTGVVLGGITYLVTSDIYTSITVTGLYIAGESMGWGKWVGGVYTKYELPETDSMLKDREGRNNGIHYLANLISPNTINYYKYCFTALTIRGIYWFGLTMLPLVAMGYMPISIYLLTSLIIGLGFPLSVRLGAFTETKFSFKFMEGYWEHSEVWYGAMMDIVILCLILTA